MDPRRFTDEQGTRLGKWDFVLKLWGDALDGKPHYVYRKAEDPSGHIGFAKPAPVLTPRKQARNAEQRRPQRKPEPPQPKPEEPPDPEPPQSDAATEPPQELADAAPPEPEPTQDAPPPPEPDGTPPPPQQQDEATRSGSGTQQIIDQAAELGLGIKNQKDAAMNMLDDKIGDLLGDDSSVLSVLAATVVSTAAHMVVDNIVDSVASPLQVVGALQKEGLTLNTVGMLADSLPGAGKVLGYAAKGAKALKGAKAMQNLGTNTLQGFHQVALKGIVKLTKSGRKWTSPWVGDIGAMRRKGQLGTKSPGVHVVNPGKAPVRRSPKEVTGRTAREEATLAGMEDGSYHWAHIVGRQMSGRHHIDNYVTAPADANWAMIRLENALTRVAEKGGKVEVDAVAHVKKGTNAGVAMEYKVSIDGNRDVYEFTFDFNDPDSMRGYIAMVLGEV